MSTGAPTPPAGMYGTETAFFRRSRYIALVARLAGFAAMTAWFAYEIGEDYWDALNSDSSLLHPAIRLGFLAVFVLVSMGGLWNEIGRILRRSKFPLLKLSPSEITLHGVDGEVEKRIPCKKVERVRWETKKRLSLDFDETEVALDLGGLSRGDRQLLHRELSRILPHARQGNPLPL